MKNPSIESTTVKLNHIHLLDLNEDCLLKIFAKLDLIDLCSLAQTCTRFQWTLVQHLVPKGIRFHEIDQAENCLVRTYTPKEVNRIFKNFGSLLSEVSIDGLDDVGNIELNLLAQHCSDCLKRLLIRDNELSKDLTVKLKPIFVHLQSLVLDFVTVPDDSTLFAGLDSLIELRVCWVENCGAILHNVFPNLIKFKYEKRRLSQTVRYPYYEQTLKALTTFISQHRVLKALDLNFACDRNAKVTLFQVICHSCNELRENCQLAMNGWMRSEDRVHHLNLCLMLTS